MEIIHATPMTYGFITWPIRPPELTMVLVVKATYDIVPGETATFAERQRPCHGAVHFDDEKESPRLDTDFALLKRTGECLLAGTCHPPAPTRVSSVGFGVGAIKKRIAVFGARHWRRGVLGKKPSEPELFSAMPLRWERAFGGSAVVDNPLGAGVDKIKTDAGEVHVPLPNLEDPRHPVASPTDRPPPCGAFPIPPTWRSRLRFAGTYDQRWADERFPHLATDFDPAFYYAAPADQRLREGFWRGDEKIELKNLRPGQPEVSTTLPGIRPRGFLDRGGKLDEVPLSLDTITVDADAGQILCTWRGSVQVQDPRFSDVRHLFLMDQRLSERRSVKSCRRRLHAHLRLEHLVESGFEPVTPGEEEQQTRILERLQKTFGGDSRMAALLGSATGVVEATVVMPPPEQDPAPDAPEEPAAPEPEPEPVDPDAVLAAVYADLAAQGMDLSAVAEAKTDPPKGAGPDIEQLEQTFASAGLDVPEEVRTMMALAAEVEELREAQEAEEEPPLELGSREEFLLSYAEGRPLKGDFTGVDLSDEDLTGLNAEGALLSGARFSGCNLSGADLSGAALAGADFTGADLRDAKLEEADLTRADLTRAVLRGAVLDNATFEDAVLIEANLEKASLVGVEASRSNLADAKLRGATLDAGEFSRANFTRVDAREASLVDTRLSGACCLEANFEEANLERVRGGFGARFDGALLRGVRATGARFFGSSFSRANLSLAQLDGADFSSANLQGAMFIGCSLRKGRFVGASLIGAQLIRCDLMKANLLDANLEDADLRGSSLHAAELFRARTRGAKLELAILTGTKLEGRTP